MSETIKYRLPFPPSVNTYWRRKGHLYFIGPPGKKFIRAVRLICAGAGKLNCRLSVELKLTMPDHRERDIDNYVKSTLDALAKAGVFANDSLFCEYTYTEEWFSNRDATVAKWRECGYLPPE